MADKSVGVKGYQRRSKTGKVINVRTYKQDRNMADEIQALDPTRPKTAAKNGTFANGRNVPGQFPQPVVPKAAKSKNNMKKSEFEAAKKEAEDAGHTVEAPAPKKTSEAGQRLQQVGAKVTPDKGDKSDNELANKIATERNQRPVREKMDAKNAAARDRRAVKKDVADKAFASEQRKSERGVQRDQPDTDENMKPDLYYLSPEELTSGRNVPASFLRPGPDFLSPQELSERQSRLADYIDSQVGKEEKYKDENGNEAERIVYPPDSQETKALHSVDGQGNEYTDERAAQHEQIINDILLRHASVPRERKAVVAGGLGGAGKSTVLGKFAGIDSSKFLTLNPDEIKETMAARGMVPANDEFSPMELAGLIHEESGDISKELGKRARALGMNLIYDITLAGKQKGATKKFDELEKSGYDDVEGVFVSIPVNGSVERALQRYQRGLEEWRRGDGFGGRYVPLQIITDNRTTPGSSMNQENFDAMDSRMSASSVYDNSVFGRDPVLLRQRKRAARQEDFTQVSDDAMESLQLAATRLRSLVG